MNTKTLACLLFPLVLLLALPAWAKGAPGAKRALVITVADYP